MMRKGIALLFLLLVLVLSGCEKESYDTGDNKWSYMNAEFALVHTSASATADYAVTDDGERLTFSKPLAVSWAQTADSIYRSLVYYNKKGDVVEPITASQVLVAPCQAPNPDRAVVTDPLTFESAWAGGGYLNVGFAVKTGKLDSDTELQALGFLLSDVTTDSTGLRTAHVVMIHSQNGQPEYYSVRGYASMPWPEDIDRVSLTVNTYVGKVVKTVDKK